MSHFFLNPHVTEELSKIPKATSETLINMMIEKITYNESFKDEMSHLICLHFVNAKYKKQNLTLRNRLSSFIYGEPVTLTLKDQLNWMINTPLLEPVFV